MTRKIFRLIYRHLRFLSFLLSSKNRLKYYRCDRTKDINLNNKTIQFKAKNSPLKTKIIPEILWTDLPDLKKLDKEAVLFTPDKIGGEWETAIGNRRDCFTKCFKRVIKDHFNLGADYGLYSFRHTDPS